MDVPIWLMGYRADLMQEGIYLTLAREGLYDALVIPDITEAERQRLAAILDPYRVSVLGFINPVQSNAEIEAVATTADLIYHQLYCGPTGVAHDDDGYLSVFNRARNCRRQSYMKENEPELYARTRCFLISSKDYVIARLTGECVSDPTACSTACAMDLRTKQWSEPILKAAGLEASRLPRLCASHEYVGGVTEAAAEKSRLCHRARRYTQA